MTEMDNNGVLPPTGGPVTEEAVKTLVAELVVHAPSDKVKKCI